MNIDYEKMWQEIIEGINENEKLPHEKTMKDFMEEASLNGNPITEHQARRLLKNLVEAGILTRRIVRKGHPVFYSPAIKDIAK